MTRISVYIATSIDGYIATEDESLAWLEAAGSPDEDYGFQGFLDSVDALAMGRGTYDHIQHLDPLPFGERDVFVFTSRSSVPRHGVTFWSTDPRQALDEWRRRGLKRVYVDGGVLISAFLAEGLVDDMLLTTVPILLGRGRPLFHPVSRVQPMRLTGVQEFPSGMVNRSYQRSG